MNKGLRNSALWLIVAIILYRQTAPLTSLVKNFPLNDFSVYIDGTKTALNGENPYSQKYFDRFNYPPAAAVFFIPFVFLPINIAELIFTGLSILSLWLTVGWMLKILGFSSFRAERSGVEESRSPTATNPDRLRLDPSAALGMTKGVARDDKLVMKWLVFALSLKMFPVKLTLALGQINLIILTLIIGAFYFCEGPALRRKAGLSQALSGVFFGLATAIKLTPAPILFYFLARKKWQVADWWMATIVLLTAAGITVFGWDLTRYYFVSVVPGLMGEVTRETINASYMNQSVTAFLARVGIFGFTNTVIRLAISGGLLLFILVKWIFFTKNTKVNEKHELFLFFWSLAVISILFLSVFVWQHHFVFLLPVWIILLNNAVKSRRLFDWLAAGISYGLLNFYFQDANWLSGKNPLIISHFLLTGLVMWIIIVRHPERRDVRRPEAKDPVSNGILRPPKAASE